MYLFLVTILFLVVLYIRNQDRRVHPHGFPLVVETDAFMDPKACTALANHLLNHKVMCPNGFCIKFNHGVGTEQSFIDSDLKDVYDLFMRIKEPGTVSFICNVMILPVNEDVTVGGHYDKTIEQTDWLGRDYMPLCSTVVYLNLPVPFEGGQLYLHAYKNEGRVHKRIEPVVGKMVRFRGDMFHWVDRIYSPQKDVHRLSIVFEQYTVRNTKHNFHIEDIFTEGYFDEQTGRMHYA